MVNAYDKHGPYATVLALGGADGYSWLPQEARDRANAYEKYDQLYWNDSNQFELRVLADEFPVYIPNPRTVVDTTSHYYLKGLSVAPKGGEDSGELGKVLADFLKREMFYSRFHAAKHTGVTRGDYAFHLTADPTKPAGRRLSLTPLHPSKVIIDTDPDDVTRVCRVHLVELVPHPDVEKAQGGEKAVKELLYWYNSESGDQPDASAALDEVARGHEGDGGARKVMRVERLWSTDKRWWMEEERELLGTLLPAEALPDPIDTIPVYWFGNLKWDEKPYGYSELRGFERVSQSISQVTTDQGTALSLEGLGVYATDGGKPVSDDGKDAGWEIYPGFVAEVPGGAYFRRVEGVGSVKPNMDHINYLESKIREAGGLSDVALGRVDVQTAQSGIALAIKFMPTLAKIDERDKAGVDRLTQLFYDWKNWWAAYEGKTFTEEIQVLIGDKLPTDRTGRINELNNMLDRGVISKKYYRDEMQKLGYDFPADIEDQIDSEKEKEAEQKAALAPPGLQDNAVDAVTGAKAPPPNPNQPGQVTEKKKLGNQSNNAKRPNESGGTEAHQKIGKQARGGKPTAGKKTPERS